MLDHVSFAVTDYEKSLEFYDASLAALGYQREITLDFPSVKAAGYGDRGLRPGLWISAWGHPDEVVGKAQGVHVAFQAPNVAAVKQWYQTYLALSGKENGEPGPRPHYHAGYYGAFIIDPNGWRIEACFYHFQP